MKYRKKHLVQATQWHDHGDHASVERRWWCPYCKTFYAEYINGCHRCHLGEPGTSTSVVVVGAIQTLEGWLRVTPGDWIVTGIDGEHWPIKPDKFAATYEAVEGGVP